MTLSVASRPNEAFDPFVHARPAYPGQDLKPLAALLHYKHLPSKLSLDLCTLDDGFVWIEPGQDGVLFANDGTPVDETVTFRRGGALPDPRTLAREAAKLDFDIFVSVDAVWHNYYHWLCLALPKMIMARHIDSGSFKMIIPDYRSRNERGWISSFGEEVLDHSVAMAGLSECCVRLKPGIYNSPRIHTILVDSNQAAFLSCFDDFVTAFDALRQQLHKNPASPKRLHIRRRGDERMTDKEFEILEPIARKEGFVQIYLEDLGFIEQAELFFNADAIIAAHGAGLSNLIFGNRHLRVLEINRRLYNDDNLRPWFYLLACGQRQYYSHLNASSDDIDLEKVTCAVKRLCSRVPAASPNAPWWSIDLASDGIE